MSQRGEKIKAIRNQPQIYYLGLDVKLCSSPGGWQANGGWSTRRQPILRLELGFISIRLQGARHSVFTYFIPVNSQAPLLCCQGAAKKEGDILKSYTSHFFCMLSFFLFLKMIIIDSGDVIFLEISKEDMQYVVIGRFFFSCKLHQNIVRNSTFLPSDRKTGNVCFPVKNVMAKFLIFITIILYRTGFQTRFSKKYFPFKFTRKCLTR